MIENEKGDQKLGNTSKTVTEEVAISSRAEKPVIIDSMYNLSAWLFLRYSVLEKEDDEEVNLCHIALPPGCYPLHPLANSDFRVKRQMSS